MTTLATFAADDEINLGETHVIPYGSLVNGIVNNRDTATYTKNVTIDGKTCVEIVPNEESTIADPVSLDCWEVGSKGWDLDKFNYAIVSYKYVTEEAEPSFAGRMQLQLR